MMLSGLAVMIYIRIDQIMLGQMLGSDQVGLYAAATKISELWYFIPVLIVQSVFPAIIRSREQDQEQYHRRLQQLFVLLVGMAYPVALLITFMADWLIGLLYGVTYTQAGLVLAIHVWTGIFVSLGVASGSWYVTENLTTLAFYRTLQGAAVNIVLNFILIEEYGITGAAVATLCAQIFAALLFDAFRPVTMRMFRIKCRSLLLMGMRG